MSVAASESAALFLFKPGIHVGESVTGYVSRISVFATHQGVEMTLRLQSKSAHKLAWLFPSGLERLSDVYGGTMPSAELLLQNNTLFPLIRPFLANDSVAQVRAHYLASPAPGIAGICGFNSYGLSSSMPICRACIDEDKKKGMPYWRASHFVPRLALCPVHLETLYDYCGKCVTGFRQSMAVWIPKTYCACGGELVPRRVLRSKKGRETEVAISTAVRQILIDGELAAVGNRDILSAIARRAKQLGIGRPGGLAKIRSLLEHRIGTEAIDAYKFVANTRSVFHFSLQGKLLSRNPVHNILLILTLFDGLDEFLIAIKGVAVESKTSNYLKDGLKVKRRDGRPNRFHYFHSKNKQEVLELRGGFRARLLGLKDGFPNLKRMNLRETGERELSYFLLEFDKEWFDAVLPRRPFISERMQANEKKRGLTGRSIAEHVHARSAQLRAAGLPARITHRRLMQGWPLAGRSKADLHEYPEARQALESCVESIEAWRIREVEMLLEHAFSLSDDAPFHRDLDAYTRSHQSCKRFKERIRKWLRANAST